MTRLHSLTTPSHRRFAVVVVRILLALAVLSVTIGQGAGQSNPPSPADWQTPVRWFLDRFDGDVDIWGVANEPNTGWLAGAHSGNPCLLAGYYAALHAELASRGGVDLLVSPEW